MSRASSTYSTGEQLIFVNRRLSSGELWPDPALQLNPAYQEAETLGELAAARVIRDETSRFFGQSLRLYSHQKKALDAARRGVNYLVTTGTGSGKSLTYLTPIYDAIMRDQPERGWRPRHPGVSHERPHKQPA